MKFLFKYMSEPFDFSKSNAVTLVIENKKLFRHTILSVSECDCNEMFVFSENFKPLDFFQNQSNMLTAFLHLNFLTEK